MLVTTVLVACSCVAHGTGGDMGMGMNANTTSPPTSASPTAASGKTLSPTISRTAVPSPHPSDAPTASPHRNSLTTHSPVSSASPSAGGAPPTAPVTPSGNPSCKKPINCSTAYPDASGGFRPGWQVEPGLCSLCTVCQTETVHPCTTTADTVCAVGSNNNHHSCSQSPSRYQFLHNGTVIGVGIGIAVICALCGFFAGAFISKRAYAASRDLSANFNNRTRNTLLFDTDFDGLEDDDLLGEL